MAAAAARARRSARLTHRVALPLVRRNYSRMPSRRRDLVQDAFVKGLERGGELRDDESARAWFYRVLRNAVVDSAPARNTVASTVPVVSPVAMAEVLRMRRLLLVATTVQSFREH